MGFSLRDAPRVSFAQLEMCDAALGTSGAYAIRADDGELVYMGYSKNVARKLHFHRETCPTSCASFQTYVPPLPPELVSPDMLESVLEYWVRETGGVPRGNSVDRELWETAHAAHRKPQTSPQVPVRERTTNRRAARASAAPSATDGASNAFGGTAPVSAEWNASQ
ncbi:unnamed protein product, partial [Agarophyton chilense]